MALIKNGIVPYRSTFYEVGSGKIIPNEAFFSYKGALDKRAICAFAACGFFLDDDSWFENIKAIPAAYEYELSDDGIVSNLRPYFKWTSEPDNRSLAQVSDDFAELFESLIETNTKGKRIILPLSGGLDSRSLAAAVDHRKDVFTYSYEFENGIPETWYSSQIASACGFPFKKYIIGEPYLWDVIERIGTINKCCSEFTHARQMGVIDDLKDKGEIFLLGHCGDLLFNDMGIKGNPSKEEQLQILYKKILKKGGVELGRELWLNWKIEGSFDDYIRERLATLFNQIEIDDVNAHFRAFKAMYWVPRWTSSNLSIFEDAHPMFIPYYHDDICRFITTVSEECLAGRQVQIEYLKKHAPSLAKIQWQTWGLDLYHYKNYFKVSNLHNRIFNKVKQYFKTKPLIQRNWEIQFLGEENSKQLDRHLLNNKVFIDLVPTELTKSFLNLFREKDGVYYSHAVSILLTMATFKSLQK